MGITQQQVDLVALDGGLEADALDFQLLDKALAHALDHVIDEGAAQAVQRLGLGILAVRLTMTLVAVQFGRGAARAVQSRACPWGLRQKLVGP